MRLITSLILVSILLISNLHAATPEIEDDQSAAVILAYSQIGDDFDYSLPQSQFENQIKMLQSGEYKILSLPEMLSAHQNQKSLPQKAVVITFEGAYKSALKNAIPFLLKKNIPFTILYAADNADNPSNQFMSWADLKMLHKNPLVTLGILPASYSSLAHANDLETLSQLAKAKTKHREAFNEEPLIFSYPFGEYDASLKNIIKNQGYKAALSLNSGPASKKSDPLALPRFPIAGDFGDDDYFRMMINSLPLPATDIEPSASLIEMNKPVLGFNISADLTPKDLECFASDQTKPKIEILGQFRVELRLQSPLTENRTRINCTMPVKSETGDEIKAYRWLGFLLVYNGNEP